MKQQRDLGNNRSIVPVAPAGIILGLLKHSWTNHTASHAQKSFWGVSRSSPHVTAANEYFMHNAIFNLCWIFPKTLEKAQISVTRSEVASFSRCEKESAQTGAEGAVNHFCFAHLFHCNKSCQTLMAPKINKTLTNPCSVVPELAEAQR